MAGWLGLMLLLVTALAVPLSSRAEPDAAAALTRALAAQEARAGHRSPALLPLLGELAEARRLDGGLAEAAELRRRALVITLAAFGGDSPMAAKAMADLAQIHIDRGRYLDAEPLLIAAARLFAECAPDNAAAAATLAGLARVALARGETGAALEWARRAVAIARDGPQSGLAEPLRALGAALTARRRFAEARSALDEALALDRREHGPDAVPTARSLAQLGNLYLRWDRPQAALPLLQQATAIDQDRLGPAHPFIADDLHDLGLAYDGLKRPDFARRAFLGALAVLERGAERETPRVAYTKLELSRLYRQDGDNAAAEAAFRDARRILDKAQAEEHRREARA